MFRTNFLLAIAAIVLIAGPVRAQVRITEWMYNGTPGEWVELTNVGALPVDMTGWSYDDDSRTPGSYSLGGFGTVSPGESVVFTESTDAAFRTAWALPVSVDVLGGNTHNLARNDEINIYDSAIALVDRLTFGDQNFPGSVRTQDISGNIPFGALGSNNPNAATLSSVGDGYGSYAATSGAIGNPGTYVVPEPGTIGILVTVIAVAMGGRRVRPTKAA